MSEPTLFASGFLASLSPRVQDKLIGVGECFRYRAGTTIFREGELSSYFYIVKSGRVALDVHLPSKGRRPLQTVEPGEIFSWSALAPPFIETASARAVEDIEVLGIKGSTLMDLCREDTELGFELYRSMAAVISTRLLATRLQLLDVFAAA